MSITGWVPETVLSSGVVGGERGTASDQPTTSQPCTQRVYQGTASWPSEKRDGIEITCASCMR